MATQSITINLSGVGGLAPRHWGDIDKTIPSQNLRYIGQEDQVADGVYNPFRRFGYLSPANNTFTDVVPGGEMSTTLGASETWQIVGVALSPSSSLIPEYNGTASSGVEEASDLSFSISHTIGASLSNSCLIVAVTSMTGANPTGVTWNGTAMTLAQSATTNGYVSIWYLLNPTAGTHDVEATWAVNTAEKAIHALTFTGVSAVGNGATASGTSTVASVSLSPTTQNTMFVIATGSTSTTHAPGTGQLERTDLASATNGFRYSTSTKLNEISATLNTSIYDPLNDDFYFAGGSKLFKGDTFDDLTLETSVDFGTSGTPTIMDLEIYQINGVRKMFLVYEVSDKLEIAISSLPYNSATDDPTWLSGTASGKFSNDITNHAFMRVAANGLAYVFQDNVVHKIDGTKETGGNNGTVVPNVLTFPNYFLLTDAIDVRGKMFICVKHDPLSNITETFQVNQSSVGIYIWNKRTVLDYVADFVPVYGVKSIKKIYVTKEGQIRMIVVTSERICEIREFNGSSFETIQEVGYLGYPTYHDSITNAIGGIIWGASDGHIYFHGKIIPKDKDVLIKLAKFATSTDTFTWSGFSGAILYGGSNSFSGTTGEKATRMAAYLFYVTSAGTRRFKTIDIMGTGARETASTQAQGDVYTLLRFLPQMSTLKNLEVYCAPMTEVGSETIAGTIKLYANQSPTPFKTKSITRNEITRGYIDIELNKPYVNSIQIEVEFATSTPTGSFDFAPSFAILHFEPTSTKG